MKVPDKPHICDKCSRGFKEERHLRQHHRRKTPCTKKHTCVKCTTEFKTNALLMNHLNRKTPCVPDAIPVITNTNRENRCQYCNNTYANAYNLRRHQKNCNVASNPQIMQQLVTQLMEQNRLQAQMMAANQVQVPQPQTVVNGDVTVNQVNNNMYVNVTICSFGEEDLSCLDTNKVMDLIKNHTQDFMPKMIEHVHANPDHPQFHNVYYDPNRSKAIVFAQIGDNKKTWQMKDIGEVSANITEKIKDHIGPTTGPYFNIAMQAGDADTSNQILDIVQQDWKGADILDQNKGVLTKVSKNQAFLELIDV